VQAEVREQYNHVASAFVVARRAQKATGTGRRPLGKQGSSMFRFGAVYEAILRAVFEAAYNIRSTEPGLPHR
jgi:hypothetical protein